MAGMPGPWLATAAGRVVAAGGPLAYRQTAVADLPTLAARARVEAAGLSIACLCLMVGALAGPLPRWHAASRFGGWGVVPDSANSQRCAGVEAVVVLAPVPATLALCNRCRCE